MLNALPFTIEEDTVCGSMRHAIENQLFTVAGAAREAGVARSTVQRWIREGRCKKQAGGMVEWTEIEKCRNERRTGRPHGLPAASKMDYLTEVTSELTRKFLGGPGQLYQLEALIKSIEEYHWQAGRGKHLYYILKKATERYEAHVKRTREYGRRRF